jgi:hypothetical protein
VLVVYSYDASRFPIFSPLDWSVEEEAQGCRCQGVRAAADGGDRSTRWERAHPRRPSSTPIQPTPLRRARRNEGDFIDGLQSRRVESQRLLRWRPAPSSLTLVYSGLRPRGSMAADGDVLPRYLSSSPHLLCLGERHHVLLFTSGCTYPCELALF